MNTAVITGVSSGIGLAVCRQFLRQGFLTYGIGRHNPDFENPRFKFIENDFTHFKDFNIPETVDCLVLNSGITVYKKVCDLTGEEIERVFKINFLGNALTLKSLCRNFEGDSLVFFISSIAASNTNDFENWGIYSSLKVGFEKFLRIFAVERGVKTVILRIGAVDTPLWDKVTGKEKDGKKLSPANVAERLVEIYLNRERLNFQDMVYFEEITP